MIIRAVRTGAPNTVAMAVAACTSPATAVLKVEAAKKLHYHCS
jgi:hypothetical protein